MQSGKLSAAFWKILILGILAKMLGFVSSAPANGLK